MALFNNRFIPFGLDISDKSIRIVQLLDTPQGLKLHTWNKLNLPDGVLIKGDVKKPDKLIELIKKAVQETRPKLKDRYVVVDLPETKTFLKLITLEVVGENKTKEKINEMVKKEMQFHIPLPLQEIVYDWQVVNSCRDNFDILLGVVPQKTITEFSSIISKSGLMASAIEIEAQSIIRAIVDKEEHYYARPLLSKEYNFNDIAKALKKPIKIKGGEIKKPEKEKIKIEDNGPPVNIIVDFGASRSGLSIWDDKTIKFTSSLQISGNHLTKLIVKNMDVKFEQAEKLKISSGLNLVTSNGKNKIREILLPGLKKLVKEISKAQDFYSSQLDERETKYEILLTGGSSNLTGLPEFLSKELNTLVKIANPLININSSLTENIFTKDLSEKDQTKKIPDSQIHSFATAIGLALRPFFIKDI